MRRWVRAKLVTIVVAAIAVFILAGATAVLAAPGRMGLFSAKNGSANPASHPNREFNAHGKVLDVSFDQDGTGGTLTFLPDGQQTPVTVIFNARTEMETKGGLQQGQLVSIEGMLQADGKVLATEIKVGADNGEHDQDHDAEDQVLSGIVQSVNMGEHTFVLLPDGQASPVSIAFDDKTDLEQEHGVMPLVAGAHVVVEIIKRADGSLYATEIEGDKADHGDQGHDDVDDHGRDGQSLPAPGTDD